MVGLRVVPNVEIGFETCSKTPGDTSGRFDEIATRLRQGGTENEGRRWIFVRNPLQKLSESILTCLSEASNNCTSLVIYRDEMRGERVTGSEGYEDNVEDPEDSTEDPRDNVDDQADNGER